MAAAQTRRERARCVVVALAAVAFACASKPQNAPLARVVVGDQLTAFSLEDQHGELHPIDTTTQLVLYSRDMEGGNVIREVLEPIGNDYLRLRHAVYIADISRMPTFISKTIAIPRMRSRNYSTLLDLKGSMTSMLPNQTGKATVLWLDQLRIVEVRYVDSVDELREILGI